MVMGLSTGQLGSTFDTVVLVPVLFGICIPSTLEPASLLTGDTPDIPVRSWLVKSLMVHLH